MPDKQIEKPKKPRSPAQIAAFEKAKTNRLAKIAERKAEKEGTKTKAVDIVDEEPAPVIEKANTNDFPKTMNGVNPMKQQLEVEVVPPKKKAPVKKQTPVKEETEDSDSSMDLDQWLNAGDDSDDEDYEEEEEVKPTPLKKTKSTKTIPPKPKVAKPKVAKPKKQKEVIYITDSDEEEEVVYKKKPKAQSQPAQPAPMDWRDKARLNGF